MRRPWIKIETCTPDKPEICTISTALRMDTDAVVGKLVRLWAWAELNRVKANDLGVTLEFLDQLVGRKGFGVALIQSGWLKDTNGTLSLPHFERHNGIAAKDRVLTAQRVRKHRAAKAARNSPTVTEESHESGRSDTSALPDAETLPSDQEMENTVSLHNVSALDTIDVAQESNATSESAQADTDNLQSTDSDEHAATEPHDEPAHGHLPAPENPLKKRKSKTDDDGTAQPLLF